MHKKNKPADSNKYLDKLIKYSNSFNEILSTRLYPSIILWRSNRNPDLTIEIINSLDLLEKVINKIILLDVPEGHEYYGYEIRLGYYEVKAGIAILRKGFKQNDDEIIKQGKIFTKEKALNLKQKLVKFINKYNFQN